jgi:hypothetical protein
MQAQRPNADANLNGYSVNSLKSNGTCDRIDCCFGTATLKSRWTMRIWNKLAIAALAAVAIAGTSLAGSTTADARPGFRGGGGHFGGGHFGGFRGGRGFGIGAGIATGLAIGGLGYGYGYGYPYYGGDYAYADYGYGGCYLQRRLVVDQWGRRFFRPVRVCS